MDDRNTAGCDKPTFIYGLVDPITQQLRYVGKTVLKPERRLLSHIWRAKAHPEHRHSMAWIASLARTGALPEVVTIEIVPAGGDWVEAEQFWIAYFRSIGADLCNHTSGGEGAPGLIRSKESIAKMMLSLPRGERHSRFGKPMPEHVKVALLAGAAAMRGDPVRKNLADESRIRGMTPEKMMASIDGLRRVHSDPIRKAAMQAKATASAQTAVARSRVSAQSKAQWERQRDKIIAAQSAGRDEDWRRRSSEWVKASWRAPGNKNLAASRRRRRLSDEDVAEIKRRIASGDTNKQLAGCFGVDPSLISHIRAGRKR